MTSGIENGIQGEVHPAEDCLAWMNAEFAGFEKMIKVMATILGEQTAQAGQVVRDNYEAMDQAIGKGEDVTIK